uniref:Uncharacterized protein n=1 Tax=Octopus bimaculoides TaxID=37653 RepID=A0A0L8GWD5_OCTBM
MLPLFFSFFIRMNPNPRRITRKTAKALDISKSSMYRIFKEHLKLTAYKKQPRQLISAASNKKWLVRGKTMLAQI